MSNMWVFIGGVVVGIAGLVTTVLIWDKLENDGDSSDEEMEQQERLTLPRGSDETA